MTLSPPPPSVPQQATAPQGQSTAAPQGQPVGLYRNPRDAVKSLNDGYSYWTGKLTESSFALSLAVIGANWAVFGSVEKVLKNNWAIAAIATVISNLGISVIAGFCLGQLLHRQIVYAEKDPIRWQTEFEASIGKKTHCPSTSLIDWLAFGFRILKAVLPVVGGVLVSIAFFTQPKAQPAQAKFSTSSLTTHFAVSSAQKVEPQPYTVTPAPILTPTPTVSPTATTAPTAAAVRPTPAHRPKKWKKKVAEEMNTRSFGQRLSSNPDQVTCSR